MKTGRFSESQIIGILKQQEAGMKTGDICREHGISQATFYNWKSKYGGMEASDVKRLRDLEQENARLKRMYAELSLDHQVPRSDPSCGRVARDDRRIARYLLGVSELARETSQHVRLSSIPRRGG